MSVGELIVELVSESDTRVTWPTDPGPVRCNVCGRQSHATYYDVFEWWFRVDTCSRCIDLQQLEVDKNYTDAQAAEWQRAMLAASGLHAAELAYSASWMDSRMRGIHFVGDTLTDAERALPIWRYVYGAPGTGTTAQLALAVRYYIGRRRKRGIMTSCQALITSLYKDGSHTVQDYIDVDVLAIDKFGVGVTEWGGSQLAHILDERKRRLRPTLFASHMPLSGEGSDIESHKHLLDGTVAAAIFGQCGGHRGLIHLTKQRRSVVLPSRKSTFQQRINEREPRAVRRQDDDSPI